MFIVITGLDGSGTSAIAEKLSQLDKNSTLLKTPSKEYADRSIIDRDVRSVSKIGHFLYYLSATVYMSDYIKENLDHFENNVYCVRYLIDTVVSNRVAGVDVDLDYNIYGNDLLEPDLTIFVYLNEDVREKRITVRGKSDLDKVLDDESKRTAFMEEFSDLLNYDTTIYVSNDSENIDATVKELFEKICQFQEKKLFCTKIV